jgi:hypothetical protein
MKKVVFSILLILGWPAMADEPPAEASTVEDVEQVEAAAAEMPVAAEEPAALEPRLPLNELRVFA